MNRKDIIKLARESGFRDTTTPVVALGVSWEQVQRFAALVAAHEREACAKVCDVLAVHPEYASDITKVAAQAIRARGQA
jgi:hypothetical protein